MIISSCSPLHITHVCWLGAMVRPSERSLGRAAAFGRSTEGRSTAASEQTRMASYRTATDSHAEKSGSGAGGAGAAAGRVVSGAAAEGRSTAVREQTRVM